MINYLIFQVSDSTPSFSYCLSCVPLFSCFCYILAVHFVPENTMYKIHVNLYSHSCRQSPCHAMSPAFILFQGTLQEVIAWGLLGWKLYANVNGPIHCKALSSLGVTQIVCSEKGFLILSSSGAVYTQNYKSTTLVSSVAHVFINAPSLIKYLCVCCRLSHPVILLQAPMLIHGLSSRKIVKLAAHPDGQHYLALSSNGEVFSWGCGDGGRLGHGDTT